MTQVSNKIKKGTDECPIVKVKKKIKTIPTSSYPISHYFTIAITFIFILFYFIYSFKTVQKNWMN